MSHRLFFAVFPDPAAAATLGATAAAVARAMGVPRAPDPARLHVTVQFLGEFDALPQPLVDAARAAAASLVQAPFPVCFDRLASFGRRARRPVVLLASRPSAGLAQLQSHLADALAAYGVALDPRPFLPHLTLCHARGPLASVDLAPVGWTVRELRLMHSPPGRAPYRCLAGWPLVARPA